MLTAWVGQGAPAARTPLLPPTDSAALPPPPEMLVTAVAAGKVTDIDKAVKDAGVKANQILKDNQ
jgi:hypothetical protein